MATLNVVLLATRLRVEDHILLIAVLACLRVGVLPVIAKRLRSLFLLEAILLVGSLNMLDHARLLVRLLTRHLDTILLRITMLSVRIIQRSLIWVALLPIHLF